VRDKYIPNHGTGPLDFSAALDFSSRRRNAPLAKNWAVDWSLFFEDVDGHPAVNFSRRIGPCFSRGLMLEDPKTPRLDPVVGLEFRDKGLPSRDFLTSSYSGLWSVPKLFGEVKKLLRERGLDDLLPEFDVWIEPMRLWLKGNGSSVVTENDRIMRIVNDPPLPFFVLFEAAHEIDTQGKPRTVPYDQFPHQFVGKGGQTLGRFGSILVADPIFRALRSTPFDTALAVAPLHGQIGEVCQAMLGKRHALDSIIEGKKLDTMPDLLAFLSEFENNFA
jgi:hypothetical protein